MYHRHERKARFWPAAIVVAGILLAAGCGGSGEAAEDGPVGDSVNASGAEKSVNVEIRVLEEDSFTNRLILVGEVAAEQDAVISSETAGVLREIVSDRGSRVSRGDTLMVVDARRAEAALAAAGAQQENALLDFKMAEKLFLNGQGISANDYLKARNALDMTEAALANARIDLENCFVLAPFGGTVAERFVDTGELVAPGSPLLQLVQTGALKVRSGVPENQALRVKQGMEARIRVPEAGIEQRGFVHWVGVILDSRSRSLPLEVTLSGDGRLRPGMVCQVALDLGDGRAALAVPLSVVQQAPDHRFVFVAEDGRASARRVTTGARDEERVEVLEGLEPGDSLVITGFRDLVEGQPLRIVGSP